MQAVGAYHSNPAGLKAALPMHWDAKHDTYLQARRSSQDGFTDSVREASDDRVLLLIVFSPSPSKMKASHLHFFTAEARPKKNPHTMNNACQRCRWPIDALYLRLSRPYPLSAVVTNM